jgi:alkylation response protein AidB-like acyl-CoA dehydrogenase
MLVDTVRRFIQTELAPLEQSIEESGVIEPSVARAVHEKSKALGLYAMNMPAEHGGGGSSVQDRILCEEQLGHSATTGTLASIASSTAPAKSTALSSPRVWPSAARRCSMSNARRGQ